MCFKYNFDFNDMIQKLVQHSAKNAFTSLTLIKSDWIGWRKKKKKIRINLHFISSVFCLLKFCQSFASFDLATKKIIKSILNCSDGVNPIKQSLSLKKKIITWWWITSIGTKRLYFYYLNSIKAGWRVEVDNFKVNNNFLYTFLGGKWT